MKRLTLVLAIVMMAVVVVAADGPSNRGTKSTDTRVYVVGDLVLSAKQQSENAIAKDGKPSQRADFGPLVELLTSSVAADSWTADGGKDGRVGSITPFLLNNSLIVKATPEVHDQVVKRLRQLRKLAALRSDG